MSLAAVATITSHDQAVYIALMRRCFEFSPFSHRCHRDVQKMAVAERMRFFPLMAAVLLGLLLGTTNQQLSSLLGYQGSSGVREALLAVNAFCGMSL